MHAVFVGLSTPGKKGSCLLAVLDYPDAFLSFSTQGSKFLHLLSRATEKAACVLIRGQGVGSHGLLGAFCEEGWLGNFGGFCMESAFWLEVRFCYYQPTLFGTQRATAQVSDCCSDGCDAGQ